MKSILLIMVAFVLLSSVAFAVRSNPSYECSAYCGSMSYPVAKYDWDDSSMSYLLDNDFEDSGYAVDVSGDTSSADWTADPAVDCVIHKEATDYFTYDGGASGTINKVEHDISHITFCADENEVPEFGVIAAGIAIAGAIIGMLIIRRRH